MHHEKEQLGKITSESSKSQVASSHIHIVHICLPFRTFKQCSSSGYSNMNMIFSNFSFKTYSKLANATKIEPNLKVNHTDEGKIRKIIENLQKQQKYPNFENFAGFKSCS